ncbi:MAG TPA: carboxypeptidase-like regulatory domain-containing protein [Gemmatimonadaceae bacterium]
MTPLGRKAQIPELHPRTDFGALTGAVIQAETGDAIESAEVDLRDLRQPMESARIWRLTNSNGGYSFDSLDPGTYGLRVRRLGEIADTATIRAKSGRIDTLTLRMHAYRCHGY